MSTFVSVEGYSLRLDSKEAVKRFTQLLENDALDDFISDCFNQAVTNEQQSKSLDSVLVKLDELMGKMDSLSNCSIVSNDSAETVAEDAVAEVEEVEVDLSADGEGGIFDLLGGFDQFK